MTRLFRYAWTMRRFRLPAFPVRNPPILRRIAKLLFAIPLAVTVASCGSDREGRPDLVLITVDTLAADRLGCFGGDEDEGRSICQLAHRGTRFGWAMVPGRGIASTMASVLTGLVPAEHGVDDAGVRFLADAHVTLAEEFAKAGYATAAFVEDPLLNQTRRLDQGFELYAAALESDRSRSDLPDRVESWIARAASSRPYFVWIHLAPPRKPHKSNEQKAQSSASNSRNTNTDEQDNADRRIEIARVDRALARLESALTDPSDRPRGGSPPGVLFAALRGDASQPERIELTSHRVPMIWRKAAKPVAAIPPPEVFALTSLIDIHPTLRAAAGLLAVPESAPSRGDSTAPVGVTLDLADTKRGAERFLLLRAAGVRGDVGIASGRHVYVRKPSKFDAAGSPVPTELLEKHAPRFLTRSTAATWSNLGTTLWRGDILSSDSPVPRLEFHLARLLRTRPITSLGERP